VEKNHADQPDESGENATGTCKWFNVAKGFGFITPDDGSPAVFVHQSVLEMPGFRSLEAEEKLQYSWRMKSNGRREATKVTGAEGEPLQGSSVRPLGKRREKLIRCFNCGEYGNHVASKCKKFPTEKVCYNCRSADHLVSECPDPVGHRPGNKKRAGNGAAQRVQQGAAGDDAEKKKPVSPSKEPETMEAKSPVKAHPEDPSPKE